MRLPLRLLEEITGKTFSAHAVAHYLEKVGFPVEEIIELLSYDPAVKTAQVTGLAQTLEDGVVLTVECGEERYYAYSHVEVAPESVVAVALSGSALADDVLKNREGVTGVILTEKELGLADGIPVILPKGTATGVALSDVIESTVLNVEITPNRGDLYSLYGLARELSPLMGESFVVPAKPALDFQPRDHKMKLHVEAVDDIKQYYGFVIEGVRVISSPFWLKWRLHAFGARPVNNVVDISNYVMFLTGQPLHAFDASRVGGSVVKVKRAASGEKFTAIDHREYTLTHECLLIADDNHPLALAGIMGGEDSEVGPATHKLFLEAAEFTSQSARWGIGRTALQSDSSKRFAAGVDGAVTRDAALLFMNLLADISPDIAVLGELAWGNPAEKGNLELEKAKLDSYANMDISLEEAVKNLGLIGFGVQKTGSAIQVKIPAHRNDVTEDVDLIEEVLRLRGYDDLPSRFKIMSETPGRIHDLTRFTNGIRKFLSGLGLTEVFSLSLVSDKELREENLSDAVEVSNPLSERMNVLRPSLLTGLVTCAGNNIRFGEENLALFEIGNVFAKTSEGIKENLVLGILLAGKVEPLSWDIQQRDADFFDLKGIIEMLYGHLGFNDLKFVKVEKSYFEPEAVQVLLFEEITGSFGRVSRKMLDSKGISKELYLAEIELSILYDKKSQKFAYNPLSRFLPAERDIALLLSAETDAQDIMQFVRKEAATLSPEVDIFDSFSGPPLPDGKRNLGLRLRFAPQEENLSKDELDDLVARLAGSLARKFDAVVRGREGDGS